MTPLTNNFAGHNIGLTTINKAHVNMIDSSQKVIADPYSIDLASQVVNLKESEVLSKVGARIVQLEQNRVNTIIDIFV